MCVFVLYSRENKGTRRSTQVDLSFQCGAAVGPSFACVHLARVRNVLHSYNHREGGDEGHPVLPPRVPGRPKNDIRLQQAYVSQLSPNSHTVQGGCVHLYRLLTIAEILRASSRPGRCDENFCDGSFCAASFCHPALMFVFVHPTQQRSSQSSRLPIGRYAYKYICIFICIRCCKRLCHQVRD